MAKNKRFSEESVSNPLRPLKKSAYFSAPVEEKTERVNKPSASALRDIQATEEIEEMKKGEKRGRPKFKRETSRHSFEFYKDQVTRLRTVKSIRELRENRTISLSEVVRDALDAYITEFEQTYNIDQIISRTI